MVRKINEKLQLATNPEHPILKCKKKLFVIIVLDLLFVNRTNRVEIHQGENFTILVFNKQNPDEKLCQSKKLGRAWWISAQGFWNILSYVVSFNLFSCFVKSKHVWAIVTKLSLAYPFQSEKNIEFLIKIF